jgi:hypothetical protein
VKEKGGGNMLHWCTPMNRLVVNSNTINNQQHAPVMAVPMKSSSSLSYFLPLSVFSGAHHFFLLLP